MTLIAAFELDGCPILFGDLLITGLMEPNDRIIAVPAVGEVQDFFGPSGWAITGLNQKVTILSSNCIIAWAGSKIGAKNAITDLKLLSQNRQLTGDIILQHLSEDKDLQQHPASFVGFILQDNGIWQFHFNADLFESPSLGAVYLSGSGSNVIHEFSNLLTAVKCKTTGEVNNAHMAISRALTLGSLLLQAEFHGGDSATTLRNMFGGGYEIALYLNGSFQKLSDFTYLFWQAELKNDNINISMPQFIVKQKYIKDNLFIRSALVDVSVQGSALVIKDEQHHVIPSIFNSTKSIDFSEVANISFQSNLICHCILVRNKDSIPRLFTRVQQHAPGSEMSITIKGNDSQILFEFDNNFILELTESLKSFRDNSSLVE